MADYNNFPLSERRVLRKIDAVPHSISERDIDQISSSFSDLNEEQKETIIDALMSSSLNSESADQRAVEALFDVLDNYEGVRTHVAQSLRIVASEKPNLLSDNVEPLYDLLDQNPKVAEPVAEALQNVLIANPDLGVQSSKMLVDIIDTVHREEKPDTLDRVIKMSDHDVIGDTVTTIVNRLESEQADKRAAAARNLGWFGSTDLDIISDNIEELVYKINDEDVDVRKSTLLAIKEIIEANPKFSDWDFDALLNCVFDDDPEVRRLTLELCQVIASDNPEMLETHLALIITRIDPDREPVDEVRQAAAHTLQDISKTRPEILATDADYILECYDHTDIDQIRVPFLEVHTCLNELDSVSLDFNLNSIESLLTDDASTPIRKKGWMVLPRYTRNSDYSIESDRVEELFPEPECPQGVRMAAVEAVKKLLSDASIQSTPTLVDELILTTTESNDELTEAALSVVNNFPAPEDTSPAESRSRTLGTLVRHVNTQSPIGTSASRIVARFAKHDPEMVATADEIDALVSGLVERATGGCHEAIQSLATIAMERPQVISTEAMTALSNDLPGQISVLLEDGTAELQKASAQLLAQMSSTGVELPEAIVYKLVDVNEYDSTEVQRVVVDSLETIAQDQPSTLLDESEIITILFNKVCCHDDSIIRVYGLRAVRSLVNEDTNLLLKSESELRPAIVEAVTHDHTETSVTGMLTVMELANDDLNLLLESGIWDTIATSLQADAAIMRATACSCIQTVISETADINQLLEEKELSAVPNLLSDSDPRVRREAHKVISELGENHAALGIERYELIPLIFDSLTHEDAEVRAEAILSIQAVERSDAYVIGIVPDLVSRLNDPNSVVRKRAASNLRRLASIEPKRFKRAVENVVDIHKIGFEDSQQLARELLAIISDREPELVEPFLDSLVGTAGTAPERGGSAVLETLQHIGANSPETLNNRGLLTDLQKQALSHPDPEIREESARVLNAVAGAEFQYVEDEVDALVGILNNTQSEKIKRAAVALQVIASDVTEASERIINRGGVDILHDHIQDFFHKIDSDIEMVNEAIHLLEAIGRPQDGLYETLTGTLQKRVFSQRSAKAIAAIAANEPEWIASRNVIEEFEQVLEGTKSQSRLRPIIESLGILGENCPATTDIGRIVDLLFAAIEEGGFGTAPAAARTINSLFSNAPDIVEQPDVDTTGLEIGLDPSQDYDVKMGLTSAIVSISEYHPEYLVDTPIISPLIDGLEKLESTVLRNVTDAVGLIGRTHADVVSEAVGPLIANANKYDKSSTMMSPNLQIASLRALSRIAEGSPTVVVDVSDKIVDHLSGSLYAARIYTAVVILHFNSNSSIDVEEELVTESLDALKTISDLPADERDRAIKTVAKLCDENAAQLAPIREDLESIHQSVGKNSKNHIKQVLEQVPNSPK